LINNKSYEDRFGKWSLPKFVYGQWIPGEWYEISQSLYKHYKGICLITEPYQSWPHWVASSLTNFQIYVAEYKEVIAKERNRVFVRKARLLRPLCVPKWFRKTRELMASVGNTLCLQNDNLPNRKWLLFETRDDAKNATISRDFSYNFAYDISQKTISVALRKAVSYTTYGVFKFVHELFPDVLHQSKLDYIRKDMTKDLLLLLQCFCVSDKLDRKILRYARRRWKVWQKGYGLYGDINGKFYVYKKPFIHNKFQQNLSITKFSRILEFCRILLDNILFGMENVFKGLFHDKIRQKSIGQKR